jgi:hypothetical protein
LTDQHGTIAQQKVLSDGEQVESEVDDEYEVEAMPRPERSTKNVDASCHSQVRLH